MDNERMVWVLTLLGDQLQASFRDAYRDLLAPGGQQSVGLEPVPEHDDVLGFRNNP